jgi:Spy/CpxP family protein refolding chaperone
MMHQKMERDKMGPGDAPMHRLMEELQLTDAQKTELKGLRAEMEKAMVKSQADIKTARIDLRQLVLAEKPDRGAIEKKIKEISAFQHEAKMTLVNHLFSVNAKLTPEQQKKFRDHMATMLMEEHAGMPMGGRPGMMRHNMGR